MVNWSWRAGFQLSLFCYIFVNEDEAPFHWQIRRDGTMLLLLVILERKPLIYWLFERGGTILLINLGGGWWTCIVHVQLNCWKWAGVSFYIWSMLYLEDWSSSYFIGLTFYSAWNLNTIAYIHCYGACALAQFLESVANWPENPHSKPQPQNINLQPSRWTFPGRNVLLSNI